MNEADRWMKGRGRGGGRGGRGGRDERKKGREKGVDSW